MRFEHTLYVVMAFIADTYSSSFQTYMYKHLSHKVRCLLFLILSHLPAEMALAVHGCTCL